MDGVLPDGFAAYVSPGNGAVNVSMNTTSITIYYSQPMKFDGKGGSVERPEHYQVQDENRNLPIAIISRSYDPLTYALTLNLFQQGPIWQPNTLYQVTVKGSVQNACGTKQGSDVTTTFTTGSSAASPSIKLKKAGAARTPTPTRTLTHTPTRTPTGTQPITRISPTLSQKGKRTPTGAPLVKRLQPSPTPSIHTPTLTAVATRTPRREPTPDPFGPGPIFTHVDDNAWRLPLLQWLRMLQVRID